MTVAPDTDVAAALRGSRLFGELPDDDLHVLAGRDGHLTPSR